MDKDKFAKEIENYSINDIDLILSTQQELYSKEELEILRSRLDALKTEYIQKRLPKEIICSKCDSPNPFSNDVCDFCGVKLDKSKYEKKQYNFDESDDEDDEESDLLDDEVSNEKSYWFNYIISFLIPLIGYIVGAIMLSSNDDERRSVGKICILMSIIGTIINSIVIAIVIK